MRDGQFVELSCYIQEYRNWSNGQLCARLVEKSTGKRVVIVAVGPDFGLHHQMPSFLSHAKRNKATMPTIFDKDGVDIAIVRGVCIEETDASVDVSLSVPNGGFGFSTQASAASCQSCAYVEDWHPLMGDVIWRFNCSGIDALRHISSFLDTYKHDGYSLSIFDTLSKRSGAEIIDIPFDEIVKVVDFIYHTEHAEPIVWIGINSVSESYVVAMPLCKGRVSGNYVVRDGKLVPAADLMAESDG